MPERSRSVRAGLSVAVLAAFAGCTTFYGVTPDATTSSSSTGTGGAGGEAPKRLGLLPLYDAAHLCSLVASCPTLGDSIIASTGLPLVVPEAGDVRNYSSCVDWLTLPLATVDGQPPPRPGFDVLRKMIDKMAASQSCEEAASGAFVEVLAPGDSACAAQSGTRCDGDAMIDCDSSLRQWCTSAAFPAGSHCLQSTVDGSHRCGIGSCNMAEVSCSPATDPGPTEQSFVFACGPTGIRGGVDCRAFGLVCDQTNASLAARGCFGSTGLASCSTFGQESCFGAKARACSGLFQAEVDCDAIGRTCALEGSAARCERAGAECSPYDADINVCAGSSIHLCLDGSKLDLDCATIGEACIPASGMATAHCG